MKRWRSFTADNLRRKKEEENLTQRTQSPEHRGHREEKRREEGPV
jgi:hypothetical protein